MLLMISYETLLAAGAIFFALTLIMGAISSALFSLPKENKNKCNFAGSLAGWICVVLVFCSFVCLLFAWRAYLISGAAEKEKELMFRDVITVYEARDSVTTYRGNISKFSRDENGTSVEMDGSDGKTILLRFNNDQKFDIKDN